MPFRRALAPQANFASARKAKACTLIAGAEAHAPLRTAVRTRQREGFLIRQLLDPWDAPDVLEEFEARPDFEARWRGFLRDCASLVVPLLPPEFAQIACQFSLVADAFDCGRADLDALIARGTELWQFHQARRDSSLSTELARLSVVVRRLWKHAPRQWHESAWRFLHDLDDSEVPESQWFPLLLKRFEGLVTGPANPA